MGLKYRGGLILKFEVYEDQKHGKNEGKKGENGVTCGRIVMVLVLKADSLTVNVGSRHGCETNR